MSGGVRGGTTAIQEQSETGSSIENRKVTRGSSAKRAVKPRKHLSEEEVERLMKVARETGRYGERDAALILLAYRHGLRVAELVALTWHQVDLKGALLHVARRKNGIPSTQPLTGRELRALRALLREHCRSSCWRPRSLLKTRATLQRPQGDRAGGNCCGSALGVASCPTSCVRLYTREQRDRYEDDSGVPRPPKIQHTVRYTELAPGRFKGLFSD